MSIWKFILVSSEGVETEIENPQGWESPVVNIDRDPEWHGIFFGYSFGELKFIGLGFTLIKEEYEAKGVNGEMNLKIMFQCSEDGQFDLFYKGRLSFDEYSDTCGDECSVTIGLEDSNDIMLFRNNYEQKVNLNSNIAFDEETELTDYDHLNFDLEIPSRGIPQKSTGSNTEKQSFSLLEYPGWGNIQPGGTTGTEQGALMPVFAVQTYSEIQSTNINGGPYYDSNIRFNDGENSIGTPPFIDLASNQQLKCAPSDFRTTWRVKGRLIDNTSASRIVDMNLIFRAGPNPASTVLLSNQIMVTYEAFTSQTAEFDLSGVYNLGMQPGNKIYVFAIINYVKTSSNALQQLIVEFDPETSIEFSAISYCEPTMAKSYMINEALSRTVEAITNGRIRFYSTTFGRVDSQPYPLLNQTCAGLFAISNGLNVRRRLLTDGTQPGCFVTLKQQFDDLKAIWNIGISIEPDNFRPGYNYLRFEDWRYFYQNDIGIRFNYATRIKRNIDTQRLYNQLRVGYNKWTAEQYSGLDELMTERTYRLNINAVNNELEAMSDIITASYTTEITRRLDTGTNDWQYDNDLFGFCLKGGEGQEYSVETFADVAYSVQNVNDPDTCYNGRVTPARNAMRWFNFIMQGLRQITNTSKLIFTSGKANYIARFGLNDCNLEGQAIAENESIELGDFEDREQAKPITYPEIITFDHPLNYNLFKRIKDDATLKFKSIVVMCNGNEIEGWIKNIAYRPEDGTATITAIPKNTTQLPLPAVCEATVVPDSVTMTDFDFDAGTAVIDFVEGVAGATFWHIIITRGSVPGAGQGFSVQPTEHPVTVNGITPGTWSVMVIPYCSINEVGKNYATGTFEMGAPALEVQLSITYYIRADLQMKEWFLTAGPSGMTKFPAGFGFNFGGCSSEGICYGYPGVPNEDWAGGIIGDEGGTAEFSYGPGLIPIDATISSVTLFNISGITPSQIVLAPDQSFDINYV